MNQDDLCMMIAEKYYQDIFRYCYVHLDFNEENAKDCTQEVFLVLIQKKKRLKLDGNIRAWLFKTADYVIKGFRKKNRKYHNQISIDEIEIADDGGLAEVDTQRPLECLTAEEYALLTAYYDAEYGKRQNLAKQHGMTLYSLYKEIERIKKKIKMSK